MSTILSQELALFEASVVAASENERYCYPCSLALLPDQRLMTTYLGAYIESKTGKKGYYGAASFSSDFGKTWEGPVNLFSDEGPFACQPTEGFSFGDPSIGVFADKVIVYCHGTKHPNDLKSAHCYYRTSYDSGKTWSPIEEMDLGFTYFAGMNHKVLRLSDGSYVRAIGWEKNAQDGTITQGEGDQFYVVSFYRSTDEGISWQRGDDITIDVRCDDPLPYAIHGADEACYVELGDGSVYTLVRTGDNRLYESHSFDKGMTWEPLAPSPLTSHNCPADLQRLPNGDIAVVYNDHPKFRQQLCVRLSSDNCKTWSEPKYFAPLGHLYEPEAAYPVVELLPDGTIAVVWGQYKRSNPKDHYKLYSARFTREWILL